MDKNCNLNRDCPAAGLTYQPPEKYNNCNIKQQAPEPVDGCKSFHIITLPLILLAQVY